MKKSDGKMGCLVPLFITIIPLAVGIFALQVDQCRAIKTLTEDALAASNLASAIVDMQEYGSKKVIIVSVPDEAYAVYQEALKLNMGLDDNWMKVGESIISGEVEIEDYTIYNVRGTDVEIYKYGDNPSVTIVAGGLGSVTAPNGKIIETTSVYSQVTYPVELAFGISMDARLGKLVDVTDR